jgi:predicted ester cyclase
LGHAPTMPVTPANVATPASPTSSTSVWKWVALGVALIGALGCVALVLMFVLLRNKPQEAAVAAPPSNMTPAVQAPPSVQSDPNAAAPRTMKQTSVPGPAASSGVSVEEAERYTASFYRALERDDLNRITSYLDDSVDYYSFGQKDKAFVAEYTRQFLAMLPSRSFVVSDLKVQDASKPMVATLTFDVRYSARDVLGNPNTGHTRVEWDVTRRDNDLKIIRSNWMTYPDPSTPPGR